MSSEVTQGQPELPSREQLVQALRQAGRDNSTVAVLLHSTISAHAGLGPSEEKTLGLLDQYGPLGASEIAARTGLAPASVTSLVDRLEAKGLVQRVRDQGDRRRVTVALTAQASGPQAAVFGALGSMLDRVLEPYSDQELAVILSFLRQATDGSRAILASLSADR